MSPEETAELMRDLRIVRDEMPGLSVVIIEHDMFVIEGVSQRVLALNYGRKIAEGSFAEVARHAEVRAAYLGTEAPPARPRRLVHPLRPAHDAAPSVARGRDGAQPASARDERRPHA